MPQVCSCVQSLPCLSHAGTIAHQVDFHPSSHNTKYLLIVITDYEQDGQCRAQINCEIKTYVSSTLWLNCEGETQAHEKFMNMLICSHEKCGHECVT